MAKAAFPSDNQDKFMLRLPEGMRERVKAAAEKNGRSMNSEIVALLEERFPQPVQMQPEQLVDILLQVLAVSGREQSILLNELSERLAREHPGGDSSSEARKLRMAVVRELLERYRPGDSG